MSDYISQDILDQILKLLPVKSLLRFRRVCKKWKETIDSPSFVLNHLTIQKPLFITRTADEFMTVDPHNIPSVRTIRWPLECLPIQPLGSNHGIICINDLEHRGVWLWNPSIRKRLALPSFPINFESFPWWSWCFGFWIDPSSKDFKIITLVFNIDEDGEPKNMKCVLYSSTRHDWSVIASAMLWRNWVPCSEDLPLIIGCIAHWGGICESKKTIMTFDFKQESFDFIEMPNLNYFHSSEVNPKPCKWLNTLSLLYSHTSFPYRCDMYSRHHGSSVKMFSFNFIPPTCDDLWVLLLGEMEKRFWVLGQCHGKNKGETHSDLLLYDTRVGGIHLKGNFRCWYVDYGFVESLLFP